MCACVLCGVNHFLPARNRRETKNELTYWRSRFVCSFVLQTSLSRAFSIIIISFVHAVIYSLENQQRERLTIIRES